MIKPEDTVRHKKDTLLVRGEVKWISKSGKSARVLWRKRENPRLMVDWATTCRLDNLEKVEG